MKGLQKRTDACIFPIESKFGLDLPLKIDIFHEIKVEVDQDSRMIYNQVFSASIEYNVTFKERPTKKNSDIYISQIY